MMRFVLSPSLLAVALGATCQSAHAATEVALCTDLGRIVIELAPQEAPGHVANFLEYVDAGFYTGTVFHRVRSGFIAQGGGATRELEMRSTRPPVENESRNGLGNVRGSVAAARSSEPHSATAQFFVNLGDNTRLDASEEWGYTVFGRVTEGLEVADRIGELPTGAAHPPFTSDVPMPLPAILSAARLDRAALADLPEPDLAAALEARIREAARAERHTETLEWLGQYRAICGPATPEMGVAEARAARATGAFERARYALEEVLATAPAHPLLAEARALRTELDAAAAVAEARVPTASNTANNATTVDDVTSADDAATANGVTTASGATAANRATASDDTRPSAVAVQIGDCSAPPPPALPQGAEAARHDMAAAHADLVGYFANGAVYAACLEEVATDAARSAAERGAARAERERVQGAMDLLLASFNAELASFRSQH